MEKKSLKIYCDGGARGNPGPSASAFVVIENGKTIVKRSKYLGENTNNIAEYQSVMMAVTWLGENPLYSYYDEVKIFLDSELVTKQLNGEYKVKNDKLKSLFQSVKGKLTKVDTKVTFTSLPREKNKLADLLVNRELDKR